MAENPRKMSNLDCQRRASLTYQKQKMNILTEMKDVQNQNGPKILCPRDLCNRDLCPRCVCTRALCKIILCTKQFMYNICNVPESYVLEVYVPEIYVPDDYVQENYVPEI